jgi:hypothetical protein
MNATSILNRKAAAAPLYRLTKVGVDDPDWQKVFSVKPGLMELGILTLWTNTIRPV